MKSASVSLLTSLLLIAGCGGSSDGDGGLGNPPSAMLKITSGNAISATKASYEAALASVSISELSGETGLIASGPGGVSKINGSLGTSNKTTTANSQVPIPPTTSPCDVDGFVTISGDIADPFTPTLSPNDFFDIDFDMCNDGLGDVTDGLLHFVVNTFSGDFLGGLFNLTMTLTLENFQVTTGEDVLTTAGGATVTLSTLNASSVSASVSGSSLIVDRNSGSESMTNFSSVQTVNASISPSPYTMTASGTLDTTQLAGSVRYSTPDRFEGFDNDYPDMGEFLVTGDNSSARLIAIDNVNVRIELDTDGIAGVDETINTTWVELTN